MDDKKQNATSKLPMLRSKSKNNRGNTMLRYMLRYKKYCHCGASMQRRDGYFVCGQCHRYEKIEGDKK